jgi:tetrapyrrole methylase family protein / MazG family protein
MVDIMTIVIVGLGPGRPELLTLEADLILRGAGQVYLRTGRHPCAEYLRGVGVYVKTFDAVYEERETLSEVYEEIAACIVSLSIAAGATPVVYAVPGHPLVGESTTQFILERAHQAQVEVRVVDGLSFIEPAARALRLDILGGVQIVDGLDLTLRTFPTIETDCSALIDQMYDSQTASDVKLALGELYPDDHPVMLIQGTGTRDEHVVSLPLFELDRQPGIDHMTTLYVPPLPRSGSWSGLQSIVAQLRGPGGCPWDQEQTHRSLRTHLLDETYEVLDALDNDDMGELCVELGDLALQIALHIQIAIEEGEFSPTDVFGGIISKLRRRHPHVFAEVDVNGSGEVLANWEAIKREEKGAHDNSHQLDGVPATLPALSQALTYQHRAERVGYNAGNGEQLGRLLDEWMREPADERLLGEVLFALVATARESDRDLNPENALREANARFATRFKADQQKNGVADA